MERRLSCVLVMLLAWQAGPALAKKPAAVKAAAKPAVPGMEIVPWSLEPKLGETEARLGMRAERQESDPLPGTEQIIVFGKKRAPVESELVRRDAPGAEAWQSEAAQPYTPGIGDGCSYKNGCFDKDQPGLFSSVPSLFADH